MSHTPFVSLTSGWIQPPASDPLALCWFFLFDFCLPLYSGVQGYARTEPREVNSGCYNTDITQQHTAALSEQAVDLTLHRTMDGYLFVWNVLLGVMLFCPLLFLSVSPSLCFFFFFLLSFLFWCHLHFWQFARHGDKISEKKEQNVRMENASFVSAIVFVGWMFFSHSFLTTGENNAVFFYPLCFVSFPIALREDILNKLESSVW